MPNTGLRHISLKTRNLKTTTEFYTRVLGLKILFRHPPNMTFLGSPRGGDCLDFVKTNKKIDPAQGLDHFGFKVSKASLKEMEKRLKKSGVKIEGRRGKSSVYFRDPNGYMVECYCD